MTTLNLIRTERSGLLLKGETPGEELEYYDLDGEGGKASKTTMTPWNQREEYIGIEHDYDADDEGDSFWTAQDFIVKEAIRKGLEVPCYVVRDWADEDFTEAGILSKGEVESAFDELGETGSYAVRFDGDLIIKKEENSDERFVGRVISSEFVDQIFEAYV